jgi:DNA-binding CsgD family transcriptional regulator
MEVISFDKAREIWQRVVKSEDIDPFSFELEVHKRMLDFFHVGPYYYYIFNCATADFEFLDEKSTEILGYPNKDLSPEFLFHRLHPEDVSYFLNFESTITDFYNQLPLDLKLKYKTSYDIRIKAKDGKYVRVLQQVTTIQVAEDGSVLRTLGIHTDITHLKPEGKPVLNFTGLQGAPSYYNVQSNVVFEPEKSLLTKREKEIVKLIVEGHNTEMIADQLHISRDTVKTHRRNIRAKTQTNSPVSLTKAAVEKGWI